MPRKHREPRKPNPLLPIYIIAAGILFVGIIVGGIAFAVAFYEDQKAARQGSR